MSSALPTIQCDQANAGLAVTDIPAALEFYTNRLGFQTAFTWGEPPTFAGVNFGGAQIFLAKGVPTPNEDTAAVYFVVDDADALYKFHCSRGVDISETIDDRQYGMRDYAVRDPHGYHLVFGQNLFNMGSPVYIERVDVPVRLEKRLAAFLCDLAEHKRMSVSSCVEEMILHTNEGVGPHTKATLALIQELKRKHGIDYDCHASYRFKEK